MSRIGKHPIPVPAEVSVSIEAGNVVTVKGPKGTLTQTFHPDMIIKQEGGAVIVNRPDDEHLHKSLHAAIMALAQLASEPGARNSKRFPVNAKGEVRLRSVLSISSSGI